MFAPLILGILAVYLILGWIFIGALDRRIAERQRSGGRLWLAILVWPITIITELVERGRN